MVKFLGGIIEWILVAVVGGFIIGFLVNFIYTDLTKKITHFKERMS